MQAAASFRRNRTFRISVIIFLMTFSAYSYFFHRYRFWNVSSRLALTYAIVDDHSFQIDKYVNHPYYDTQDRAFYKGHYYSDKIIGLSLLAVPVYWATKGAFSLIGKDPKPDFSRYAATVAIVSLSSAFLSVVLLHFLLLLGSSLSLSVTIVLFFAFGTLLFPFSSLFYPYLPASFFLMTAFYLLVREYGEKSSSAIFPILPGALIGMALLCEYTFAFPALLVSLCYIAHRRRLKDILYFTVAIAVPLSLFAAYNTACFGNPFTLPYRYLENPEFRDGMSKGLMGVNHFQWYVLYLITIHPYRGVFFYSPFLLLGFVGIYKGLTHSNKTHRLIAFIIILVIAYYLWLNASYYMWWGGGTPLSRHLLPMLPFLGLAFAWLPAKLRIPLLILGSVSVILIGIQSVVEPHYQPTEKNQDLYNPWETVQKQEHIFTPPFFSHSLPEFLKGRISINSFNRHIYAKDNQGWTLLPLLLWESMLALALRNDLLRCSKNKTDSGGSDEPLSCTRFRA